MFAATPADVRNVVIGGRDVVVDGRHVLVEDVPAALASRSGGAGLDARSTGRVQSRCRTGGPRHPAGRLAVAVGLLTLALVSAD